MDAHFNSSTPKIPDGVIICPYCGSTHTELLSLFGQQLLTVQYYCQTCRTPFEHVKDDDILSERGVAHIAAQHSSENVQ